MMEGLLFNRDVLERHSRDGFTTATDLADYLVRKGVPFREAHGIVGRAVACCVERGVELNQLSLERLREFSPLIQEDVFNVLGVRESVESRRSLGGTAISEVRRQLAWWREVLGGE
jgi:argininosuccinate lyase